MATKKEKRDYIDAMFSKRGYAQEYYKLLAEHDYDTLVKANTLIEHIVLKDRLLDRKTKELIMIAGLTLLRAERRQIKEHIGVAVALGCSKEMILEAMEMAIPGAGYVAFQHGVIAWGEFFEAEKIEPSIDALTEFKKRTEAKPD